MAAHHRAMAEPTPAAVSAFDDYVHSVESRLAKQHQSPSGFLAPPLTPQDEQRLRKGELIIEPITPLTGLPLPGALLHDWRGTAFAAGAKAADFERLMRNINAYPQYFSPQVLQAKLIYPTGGSSPGTHEGAAETRPHCGPGHDAMTSPLAVSMRSMDTVFREAQRSRR